MPRNKYPEETVQKILDVSMKLFRKGYEETTILILLRVGRTYHGAFLPPFQIQGGSAGCAEDRMFLEHNPFEEVKG